MNLFPNIKWYVNYISKYPSLKAGSHIRHKHKGKLKHKKKYVWTGAMQAQEQGTSSSFFLGLRCPGWHILFLVLVLVLMLASYVWTSLKYIIVSSLF